MVSTKHVVLGSSIVGIAILLTPVAVNAAIAGTVVKTGTGTVACPSGYRVTGGGFKIPADQISSRDSTEYKVLTSVPSGTTGWTATGVAVYRTVDASMGQPTVQYTSYKPPVYAICVR